MKTDESEGVFKTEQRGRFEGSRGRGDRRVAHGFEIAAVGGAGDGLRCRKVGGQERAISQINYC